LDWIIQEIFKLPPLLEGHRSEQLRISSAGLSFLRDTALVVERAEMFNQELSAAGLASLCEFAGIDVPGCPTGADSGAMARRIGSLIAPLFRESDSVEVEGFTVKRTVTKVYDEERKENRETKCYVFEPRR
jgi:4-diphosphocytidyl-2C-methyl-D-erythritol kinase